MAEYRRQGHPPMTEKMLTVLRRLKNAKVNEIPFTNLDDVHHRTLWALQNFDLIVQSNDRLLGTTEYTITGRGLKTLATCEKVVKRGDGICCRCGINPRTSYYPSGDLYPYCDDCQKQVGRAQYYMKGYQSNPDTPCSKCKKRKRLILPNGQAVAYCAKCRKSNRKKDRRRKMNRKLALIKAGNPPICCRCKTEPVYCANKTVYDYCHDCYRQQQNEAAQKRQVKTFANKMNEGAKKS